MSWHTTAENSLLSVSRKAMKGRFEVLFPRAPYPRGTEAALDALDEVERLEQVLSVFRFDSRVRHINRTAHEEPVRVDAELFGLILRGLDLAARTDGAVDLTSGPLWELWGFARREGRLPSDAEIASALDRVDYRLVKTDPERRTVRFGKAGVELNFGCVGKGFALDVGAARLRKHGVDRFLFQGDLSSILADGPDWSIGVAHPLKPGRRLAEIRLENDAVSTSGSQKQFFRHQGRRYSHLIDPRSGRPVEGVFSVTVLAPDATTAELLSTAFCILGPEKSWERQGEFPGVAALFVVSSPRGNGFEVQTFGFRNRSLRFVEDGFRTVELDQDES